VAVRASYRDGEETRTLREIMMTQLQPRVGKSSAELFDGVLGDFGSCNERRLHRQLKFLVDAGCARKELDWDLEIGWWRPIYFRTTVPIPDVVRAHTPQTCPHCGLKGATARTHPEHERAHRVSRGRERRSGHVAPASEAGVEHR
jgi:hypothetical protein